MEPLTKEKKTENILGMLLLMLLLFIAGKLSSGPVPETPAEAEALVAIALVGGY